jgi:periplasmic protein TonB
MKPHDLHDTSTVDMPENSSSTHPENMVARKTTGHDTVIPGLGGRVDDPNAPIKLVDIVGPRVKTWSRRADYKMSLMAGYLLSLSVLLVAFNLDLRSDNSINITMMEQEVVEMEEIEQTMQELEAPPPPRVPVPIEVPDDRVLDDVELDLDAALDINEPLRTPAPPPPPGETTRQPEAEAEIFFVVEEMPEIIGGTARLYELLTYPEMARLAGIEGLVVVQVTVEVDGRPTSPQILRRAGPGLDEAALEAVMKLMFKPGMQRSQPVRVRFNVPVRFRLSSSR